MVVIDCNFDLFFKCGFLTICSSSKRTRWMTTGLVNMTTGLVNTRRGYIMTVREGKREMYRRKKGGRGYSMKGGEVERERKGEKERDVRKEEKRRERRRRRGKRGTFFTFRGVKVG